MWPLLLVSSSTTFNSGSVFRSWSVHSEGARATKFSSSQSVVSVPGWHQWGTFYRCTLVPGTNYWPPANLRGPAQSSQLSPRTASCSLELWKIEFRLPGLWLCSLLRPPRIVQFQTTACLSRWHPISACQVRERQNGIALHCWLIQLLEEALSGQNLQLALRLVEAGGFSCG